MKEAGIPDAEYESFGGYLPEDDEADIPHHNLVTMNGRSSISNGASPEVYQQLAENVKDPIGDIIDRHLQKGTSPHKKV